MFDEAKAERTVRFIENLKHTKGQWHGENFKLLPWQEDVIRTVFGTVKENGYRQYNTAYVEISKKNGKQLFIDTPIPTPDSFTTMGNLRVGDWVLDENGEPCRVVAKSEIDDTEQPYKLTFKDGCEIICGERHLWKIDGFGIVSARRIHDEKLPVTISAGLKTHIMESIEPLDCKVEMQCIQVDSESHLYMAGTSRIPTHNSELAAAVALYLLCGDNEWAAEVYGCASDRQQASIVFDVAVDMVDQCPALKKRIKPVMSVKRLVYQPTNSYYQVLSAEAYTKHGLNVHGVIFDELHSQPNRELFDVMTKGSGDARTQPLFFLITTAGTDRNSVCFEQHMKAKDILEGRKIDNTFYPVIYGIEDDDDWTDEKNWYKANPSLGHTIDIEKVRNAFNSAKENPAEENVFRQLRLNQWVKQSTRWMQMEKWDECDGKIDEKSLLGRECYAGLDLSSSSDITAFVLVFPPRTDDEEYIILPYCWIPEENMALRVRRDHVPYDVWEKTGDLQTTEGNVIHYGFIEKFIEELGKKYHILEIAFDRWGATQMVQDLEGMGFTVVPFGQGYKDMSPATKELMKLVLEKRIKHGGHPVLRWMMDNVFVRQDPAGNIKPDKEKSTEKIDAVVALIMALDRAIRNEGSRESVYNSRGLLVF